MPRRSPAARPGAAAEVVVRRVEWRALANAGAVLVLGALVVLFALTRAHSTVQYALIGALAAVLLLAAWLVQRPRAVVVVSRRSVGWRQGGQRWDVPTSAVAAARVVPGMWTQLLLLGSDGRPLRSVSLAYFSPAELRQALRRAGLRVA